MIFRSQWERNVQNTLNNLNVRVQQLEGKEVQIMAKFDDIEVLISQANAETARIAATVADLQNGLAGGVTAAQADQIIADLTPVVGALKTIGTTTTTV